MSQLNYQIPEVANWSSTNRGQTTGDDELEITSHNRVLIVDDDPLPRELISLHLESSGFKCDAAESGEAALDRLQNREFDLVLTDMTMPGKSGLDVLRWVRDQQPTVPVILVTGLCELDTAVESMKLGAFDYVTKPFQLEHVLERVQSATSHRIERLTDDRARQELSASLESQDKELEAIQRDLNLEHEATLKALIRALDARAHETETHSVRVQAYALCLAKKAGLDDSEVEEVAQGALLHDVGMIGISDTILLKRGPLTEKEWDQVRKHPLIGPGIVGGMKTLAKGALDVIKCHHERFDGSGYPNGLKGDKIPLAARLFAVVDTYDALTSDRPYRKGGNPQSARMEIVRCAGSQLDPDLVKIFLKISQEELDQEASEVASE